MATLTKGVFYDGPLTFPVEVEGSGEIQVDPITTTQVLTRKYAQLRATYQPPIIGFAPFNDLQFPNAYFVSENVEKIEGALVFFKRTFCTIPPPRTEQRLISFTYPGASKFNSSATSGQPIGWNQYGTAYPKTRLVNASVLYLYALQTGINVDPGQLFLPIQPSSITYQGKLVDFVGSVYAPTGNRFLPSNKVESGWAFQGTTNPVSYAAVIPWIISVEQRRFMGPVWEQAVVQFTNGLQF